MEVNQISNMNLEIDKIIISIVSGKNPIEINDIKDDIHPRTFKTNYSTHKEQIAQLVTKIESNESNKKMYLLSRISYSKPNIIDIDLCVAKSDVGKIQYYFVGRDLAKFYRFLPCYEFSIGNRKIQIRPKTGTSHAKFYPDSVKDYMIEIAINLRMLDLYCKKYKMVTGHTLKETKMLGLIIPFEIPEFYRGWTELLDSTEINSQDNPVKISEGKFLFGKNGITSGRAGWMLNLLFDKFPEFRKYCCPRVFNTCDLNNFILSEQTFAVTSWQRHSRFIIKVKKTHDNIDLKENIQESEVDEKEKIENEETKLDIVDNDESDENSDLNNIKLSDANLAKISQYNILIVDPWMRGLPEIVKNKLEEKNPLVEIKMYNRIIKDQSKEGSCVLCTLARLIYLITSIYLVDKEINESNESNLINEYTKYLNTPIPDFYAYLVKFLFRKTNLNV